MLCGECGRANLLPLATGVEKVADVDLGFGNCNDEGNVELTNLSDRNLDAVRQ